METDAILGIDIAKRKFDVALLIDNKFKTKVFEEHRRIWNSNYANAFVLVSDSETIVINPKVKPDVSKPLRGKIDSFNAGIRTEIDPQTLELLSRQQINAGYFFDFVRVKLG